MRLVAMATALLLAAFFAFVGWNKAFAPLADLVRYGSWTVWLPEWLGRLVGWSEMALALGIVGMLHESFRRIGRLAAWALVANQIVAALVHLAHGELSALPQNAVLIALLLIVVAANRPARNDVYQVSLRCSGSRSCCPGMGGGN
jgi:hypothetical protein